MAKLAAKVCNIMVDTVVLEDDIDSFSLTVTPEVPVVTALSDAGPRRVVGNYDYSLDISGANDFAAGMSDAVLYNLCSDAAGGPVGVDPTGAVAAGASDPHYDSTAMMCSSYKISGAVGGRVDFAATLVGASALARTV
ncbi:MAG: hypothetical protein MUQ56_10185 [Thermoleophilia bacterium]|nr:hypothetical protein [Thermoleophilia bacterium]